MKFIVSLSLTVPVIRAKVINHATNKPPALEASKAPTLKTIGKPITRKEALKKSMDILIKAEKARSSKASKKCDNIFCFHNSSKTLSWNKTDCLFYEIDPYRAKKNPNGFKVEDCPANKKYKDMGW